MPRVPAAEAALAGIEPVPLQLGEAAAYLRGEREPEPWVEGNGQPPEEPELDLADVRGQERARRALEIAADGGAQSPARRPSRYREDDARPRLAGDPAAALHAEALEVTRIHSVAGMLSPTGR